MFTFHVGASFFMQSVLGGHFTKYPLNFFRLARGKNSISADSDVNF